jgi:hypothetical protein
MVTEISIPRLYFMIMEKKSDYSDKKISSAQDEKVNRVGRAVFSSSWYCCLTFRNDTPED